MGTSPIDTSAVYDGRDPFVIMHDEFLAVVDNLVKKIQESKIHFDHIVAIPRGGLVPAGYLSYRLGNIPVTSLPYNVSSCLNLLYDLQYANILIVDNIATTGSKLVTMISDLQELREHKVLVGEVYSCSVFARPLAKRTVSFYGEALDNDRYAVFPWQPEYQSLVDNNVTEVLQ